MSELVKVLVEELVTDKDAVKIDQTRSGEYEVIKIIVAEEDKGRIIGKNGKIAKSIRALARVSAIKQGKKVLVEIV